MNSDSKRIAKNTILLYVRMLFLMCISLYTSRIVLNVLGVNDFGVFNVVAGVVLMFSVISSSLSTSISRYITFELGKHDSIKLNKIFCTSVNVQLFISLVILFFAETLGLWFVNTQLVIPSHRMEAANWVYQCSIFIFIINLTSVPYMALIIAYEKMSIYAFITVFEAVVKLLFIFFLYFISFDKLIMYSIFLLIASFFIRIIYWLFCRRLFPESHYRFIIEKELIRKMTSFAGWSLIGTSAGVLRTQGVNILLNMYFGPVVNAANGIATQVNNAISSFASNFVIAVNPQIIKLYSQNKIDKSYQLVLTSSRLSFMLMLLLATPVIIATPHLLKLWLNVVPDYSVAFVRLILLLSLIEILCHPLVTLNQATGDIRDYQLVAGGIHLLNFPMSWILLKYGCIPEVVYIVAIILAVINVYGRVFMLRRSIGISISQFNKEVLLRVVTISLATLIITFVIFKTIEAFWGLLVLTLFANGIIIWFLGLKTSERNVVINKIFGNEKN